MKRKVLPHRAGRVLFGQIPKKAPLIKSNKPPSNKRKKKGSDKNKPKKGKGRGRPKKKTGVSSVMPQKSMVGSRRRGR